MKSLIIKGRTSLGIELGSTTIKAVLISDDNKLIASGKHQWENKLIDGIWTYSLDEAWKGVQNSFKELATEVETKFDIPLTKVGSIGISGMMHGYLPFDKDDNQLASFRTWRNRITKTAAESLTDLFQYNIPQRWSVAHVYQAILNKEKHTEDIAYMTTLAGYIHWKLTGKKVMGIGEASGMFPVDTNTKDYNKKMVEDLNNLIGNKVTWKIENVLPKVLEAGHNAGSLTLEGAKLLDPTGKLEAGIPLCPPEGDAGTGMVATHSIAPSTGNVSAGTSIFAMIVLEKPLSKVQPQIDLVTTPCGSPVAMVHCTNCSSDLDAWINLFHENIEALGMKVNKSDLYESVYHKALEGDKDCGGLLSYNYYSGEAITQLSEGRPLFVRKPDANFTFANFSRSILFSAVATLKIGMNILTDSENVRISRLMGHGGFFKTQEPGLKIMANALNTKISVMESAAEGGAWGIALLSKYMIEKDENESLVDYLDNKVFVNNKVASAEPNPEDVKGFETYLGNYEKGIKIERTATEEF